MDDTAIRSEVHRHHAVLASWLADGDRTSWAEFAAAHAPEFSLVSVDGGVLAWPELSQALRAAGGSQPRLGIAIDRIEVLVDAPDLAVVRFRETHSQAGKETRRLGTAVLKAAPELRSGCRWLAVHETAAGDSPPEEQ